jgi:hypothetical protein
MEPICINVDGKWAVLPYGQPVTGPDDVQASYETVLSWPEGGEDWQAFGLARPSPASTPPAGKVEVSRALVDDGGKPAWAVTYEDAPAPAAPTAPDNPTLGDWRVGLSLWIGDGATSTRLDDVTASVASLTGSDNVQARAIGSVAHQRLEYSNNVLRAQLRQLAPAFGFSAAEVEESLWRAYRASLGDLRGMWPLPTGESPWSYTPPVSGS